MTLLQSEGEPYNAKPNVDCVAVHIIGIHGNDGETTEFGTCERARRRVVVEAEECGGVLWILATTAVKLSKWVVACRFL